MRTSLVSWTRLTRACTSPCLTSVCSLLPSLSWYINSRMSHPVTLLANGHADENTVASQFNDLQKVFTAASSGFLTIAPAAGSNTTSPTNDELSVEFGTVIQDVASGLSAITPARVSNAADLFASVDSIIAQSAKNFGITRPGGLTLVHTLSVSHVKSLQPACSDDIEWVGCWTLDSSCRLRASRKR
ncbi:hypothetical protein BD410DRAFT_790442 [Rickenella mellea]|uniref:Uncharacterized protein n=1 Tax=Rickenella mellea TaxID=50990 RepID=A0A4Y7PZF1_9AGAM|nr:hypothetical protein BD410DRAFT_790442 [Rickenella mellea]